jgi:hypothetical protein
MLWHWLWGQHLEVSVLPHVERQRPEGKLSVERELYVESPRCHGLTRRILSASPFLTRLCRCRIIRYLEEDREKRDDTKSISMMNTMDFRLIQTLS